MLKKIFACGAALIFMSLPAAAYLPFENAVVQITDDDWINKNGTKDGFCSGIYIDQETILTAGHCLEGLDKGLWPTVINSDGSFNTVEYVLIRDEPNDYSVLRVSPNPTVVAPEISCEPLEVGDSVRIYGFPNSDGFSVYWGLVTDTNVDVSDVYPETWWFPLIDTALDRPAHGGVSGGPVFNPFTNQLQGIHVGGYFNPMGDLPFGIEIPLAPVISALHLCKDNYGS